MNNFSVDTELNYVNAESGEILKAKMMDRNLSRTSSDKLKGFGENSCVQE
jgi:hypothetical protein